MLASAQFGTKCALDVSGAFPRKLFLIFQINKTIFNSIYIFLPLLRTPPPPPFSGAFLPPCISVCVHMS